MNTKQKPSLPLDGEKPCPRCAEMVKWQALVCRYCGFEFPPETIIPVAVMLTAVGDRKINVINLIRRELGIQSLTTAVKIVERLPSVLIQETSPQNAARIIALFQKEGATLETVGRADTSQLMKASGTAATATVGTACDESEEMAKFGITLTNGQYHYGPYRYDKLSDALAYANHQSSKLG